MKIYNTATRKKEEIKPSSDNLFKIYNCGPTVYEAPQLGNFRTYIYVDVLRRALKYEGYQVKEVTNITDIEDKIIRDSQKKKIFYKDLTKKYEKIFLANLKDLNIEKSEHMPHATDQLVINRMIKIIERLIETGYAYKSEDGSVYFSIKKFKGYGKLSRLKTREIKPGARVAQDEYDKENAQDFALWKAAKSTEPSWPASFGIGRPGWHIECTAMSTMFLGDTIDIHAGGVDLIFPHHENEIAQSEAFTGKKFVKYWFHPEHLLIEGRRMGKSEGNAYNLSDLVKKFNVEPLALRLLTLMSHYRERLNFTEKSIKDAQNTLDNLRNFTIKLNQKKPTGKVQKLENLVARTEEKFSEYIADDLATPKALAEVFNLITEVNKIEDISEGDIKSVLELIYKFDTVLGLSLKAEEIDSKVKDIFDKYLVARKTKDWDKSDKLRTEIEKLGWLTEDTKCESILRRK